MRRFARERHVEVDLRWRIAEEQSTETLRLCFDEIRACRPFFIGLLGELYAWTPGDDAFTADLKEEQAWLKDLHGKSVTEFEILHDVLNNPDMARRAFFYFRDPVFSTTRGADFQSGEF
jgi:nephrocystin-3